MERNRIRHTWQKVVAVAMLLAIMVSATCISAFAADTRKVKQYRIYTSLGDSCGSGFGLDDYNKYGKFVQKGHRVTGAYPDLVAKAVGAKKLYQCCVPDLRAADLRYLLDNSCQGDWILSSQAWNMTLGGYDKATLNSWRSHYQNAVKKSNLITLDIGVNDTWFPFIAWIYAVKEDGTVNGEKQGTLMEELDRYGADETVKRNLTAFLNAIATNPQNFPQYLAQYIDAMVIYFTDFYKSYKAIVERIYELNPNATVVALSSYNPYKEWTPTKAGVAVGVPYSLINLVYQPMQNMMNAYKQSFESQYPGKYIYVDVTQTELFCDSHPMISVYEHTTMDNSGFNPHPTYNGHMYEATQIITALPEE